MKLKLYMLMMSIFAICAVSCSDDDEPVVKPAEEVAATYSGYTVANCKYFTDMAEDNQTLTITAIADATVNVTYSSDSWGDFTINGATVTESGNAYVISGTGVTVMGMNGTTSDYECSFSGTVQKPYSSVAPKAVFSFTVPGVMGGLTIEFTEGEIPANLVVAGNYSGYTKATAQYFPDGMYSEDQTVTVEYNSDGTFNVAYTSDTWGVFSIKNATMSVADKVYTLTGSGTTQMGMSADSMKEYECTMTATIDVNKGNSVFTFTVPGVMGGLTIEFTEGEMPTEE